MFLNAKKLSFLGLLLACAVLMVILSGLLEFNTLFLLAGASFGVGIAIRECGLRFGFGFYIASIFLSFFLAPNKFYCITFAAMGFYLVAAEFIYHKLSYVKWDMGKRLLILWVIKFLIFNIMFIPTLIFLPKLFYQGEMNTLLLAASIFIGQISLLVYDKAYSYFQKFIWGKIRGKLHL
ncbi:hypothetical protein [Anaerocolumna sp. MB42-C2]|uniref:hypothetical protein n=1 Tax=Anaerocolumna sp. MB42-C2 TaxID=3070997 RepID=UPI0027E1E497|nr:hypothetical protein [Anaerocolumna sp. MB42-C2]WMJ88997.1 hypothetical protein RBU59_05605 [Anaerocolumna sp. MB42-C2]